MADILAADTTGLKMDIVLAMFQQELRKRTIVLPTLRNVSNFVIKGVDTVKFPDASSLSMGDVTDGVALTTSGLTYNTDNLVINKHKGLAVAITDIAEETAVANIKSDATRRMMSAVADQIETDAIAAIKAVSAAAPDHIVQLTGTGNLVLTQADILNARFLLDKQNISEEGRFLVVSPSQEKAMLSIDGFVHADKFGSDEPIKNGQIGRVYGTPVLKSNGLADAEFLYYHQNHVAYAFARAPQFEEDRDILKIADTMAVSMRYGFKEYKSGIYGVLYNSTGL